MKLITITIFLVFLLSLSSFIGKNKINIPPGTIKLKENFYVDQTEVRNVDYREYLYWLNRIYGSTSEEFMSALPDTNVWDCVNIRYIEKYLRHPHYANFPVVGITQMQAENYCKWRSDRVYEWIMVEKKIIKWTTSKDTIFTIDNFLNGKYPTLKKLKKEEYYPIPNYSLLSKEEWEFAASSNLDISKYENGMKDISKTKLNFKENCNDYTVAVDKSGINDFKLYGMIGNVAEIISEPNIAKGGSWFHSKTDCGILSNIKYTKPMPWLGFRCKCEWKHNK